MKEQAASLVARYLVYALITVITLYPLLFVLFTAFKTPQEFTLNFWLPPRAAGFTPDNVREVWVGYRFSLFFRNSLVVSIAATATTTLLAIPAGYAFARLRFPLSDLVFFFILASLFLPVFVYVIPLFVQMRKLHLTNTLYNLVLVYTFFALPQGVYISRNFFSSLPRELAESAFVDGATHFQTFRRIMLPLCQSALSAIVILSFVNNWGEYIWVTVSNTKDDYKTIPAALSYFTSMSNVFWWYQMAALLLTIVPLLTVYVVFNRFFIRGMTEGALKS